MLISYCYFNVYSFQFDTKLDKKIKELEQRFEVSIPQVDRFLDICINLLLLRIFTLCENQTVYIIAVCKIISTRKVLSS